MCGDWWISILGLCQFLCVCGLSILAVILIKGNKKPNCNYTAGKGKQIQVDFVHKPNQHLLIESRSNLTVGLFIL